MSDEQIARRDGVATSCEDALLLNVRQAARLLNISERALYTYMQHGEVPYVRLGGRTLISRAYIEALAATGVRA